MLCRSLVCCICVCVLHIPTFAQTDTTQVQEDISMLDLDALRNEQVDTAATKAAPFSNFWTHDPHSVRRAALYSAILPGLGQAYNEKYWKIPIVYAALGTSGYFIYYWYDFYDELRTSYLARIDDDPLTVDELYDYIPSDEILLQYVEQSKRYLDLMVVVTFGVYALNVIDAVVDVHLYHFDISDDLSMQLSPAYFSGNTFAAPRSGAFGLQLKFEIK